MMFVASSFSSISFNYSIQIFTKRKMLYNVGWY